MTTNSISPLVESDWLNDQMSLPDFLEKFILIDGTFDLPISKRDVIKEYFECRIPGAVHFDLKECRDKENSVPFIMPTQKYFEDHVSRLGITNSHHIIVYDNSEKLGLYSAARVWWLFKVYGHDNVAILNGGLPKWKKDGYKVTSGEIQLEERHEPSVFKARFRPELFRDLQFMKNLLENGGEVQSLDARPETLFKGGHMPMSKNLPFYEFLDPIKKVFLPREELLKYFERKEVNFNSGIVASCGGGIHASIIAFVVYHLTGKEAPVYDGSWFDWHANTPDEPKWQIKVIE